MRVWQGLESLKAPIEAASIAVGTFDGVHLGHQALMRAAVEDARAHSRQSVVFTFDRHPAEVTAPDKVPGYLSLPDQRIETIRRLGVDDLVIACFDERFREISAEAFLHFVLVGCLGARAVLVGEDFRFGRNQEGDVTLLEDAQRRLGYTLRVLPPVMVDGEKVSSTAIRAYLRDGEIGRSAAMLGRPYALRGVVVEGEKLGRKLGYPTANLKLTREQVVPADGIYAVWVDWEGARYKGACSIGARPTVGGAERTIETYLLDFSGDLYGETIDLTFVERLRDELKFESLSALVEQIGRDVEDVRRMLRTGGE
jgi:riboflavin kinase / FMN adenylyltransferase